MSVRGRNWCFTAWATDAGSVQRYIDGMEEYDGVEYIMQEEICPETQKKHIQGYVAFKNALSFNTLKAIFGQSAHLEKSKKKNRAAAERYCRKRESATGRLWSNWYKPPRDPLAGKTMYWWQELILGIIEEEPDERTVHWFWEHSGNVGKSSLVRHLAIKFEDKFLLVQGKGADIKYGVTSCKKKPSIIVWDVPRSAIDKDGKPMISYTAIEQVKNGCFFSGKYESAMTLMDYPHVIIFANAPPDEAALSMDRWRIYELLNPKATYEEAETLEMPGL